MSGVQFPLLVMCRSFRQLLLSAQQSDGYLVEMRKLNCNDWLQLQNVQMLNPRKDETKMSVSQYHGCKLYSPTRRWFYQWKRQCSKSWSHSQNSLCSQISIRRGCACGMLDGGCLLWFTTVYYYVNGKTRRVHSRDVFYWAWITRTWRDAWTIYVTHVLDT